MFYNDDGILKTNEGTVVQRYYAPVPVSSDNADMRPVYRVPHTLAPLQSGNVQPMPDSGLKRLLPVGILLATALMGS